MSNVDQFLFELFTHGTIQNQFLHIVMTAIEYYPIMISSLNSIEKIKNYDKSSTFTDKNSKLLTNIFPYRVQKEDFHSSIFLLVVFCVIMLFLVLYFVFIIAAYFNIQKKKNSATFIKKSNILKNLGNIYVNFYDIFFMRYFSGYIMLFLGNMVINYLLKNSIYFLFVGIAYLFYVFTAYNHINTYFVIIQISNESIARDKGKYPFDIVYTRPVDTLIFIVKLIVSIEYTYTHSNATINLFTVALNVISLIILLFVSVKYSFQLTSSNTIDFYIFNKNLHLCRMVVNIFNIFFMLLSTFFLKKDTHWIILIGLALISGFWAYFVLRLIWLIKIKGIFFDGKITLQKLLYIMVQSKKENELVVTTKESFFNVNLIKIQDSIEFQHRVNCVEFSKCAICNKYTNKEPVTIFDLYKHIVKLGDAIVHNEVDILYRDLIKLFYYHIKKKIFKFYQWYRQIYIKFDKVDKTIVNNLAYIISLCLSYYDSYNVVSFNEIFQFTTLNEMIESHLKNIKNFIAAPNELKYVEKFFSLSKDIRKLRDYMLYILQHIELKEEYSSISDSFSKSVKNIYRYNLFLNRYSVETLTNSRYKELNELNLEMFDEYLSTHYNTDKLLLLNLDMDHENQHNNQGYYLTNNSYNILKCGKEFITYRDKKFVDMLPKKLKKNGLDTFINKLSKFIDYETLEGYSAKDSINGTGNGNNNANISGNIDSTNTSLFQYVINDVFENYEIALLKYSFKISRALIDEHMVIYGYYDGIQAKIAMFKSNIEMSNMKLENFSMSMRNVFYMNAEWIEILEKSSEYVYMHNIFKTVNEIKSNKNFDFECTIDYDSYTEKIKKFTKLIQEYYTNEINLQNDKAGNTQQMKDGDEYLRKLQEKSGKKVKLRLKLLFEIKLLTSVYKVYSVFLVTKKKNTNNIITSLQTGQGEVGEEWENNQSASGNSSYEKLQKNYTNSNSSMTENSVSARLSQKSRSRKDMKFSSMINTQNSKTDKISKAFATFSIFIALLNVVIITVCIIFLLIQIITTNKLKRVNTLNYEFKRIRISFAHSFLSVFTGKCLAQMKEATCENYFKDYANELITEENWTADYDVADYIITEIKYKVDDMQTTYYTFKENLFSYGDNYLLTTLSDEMIYTSFEQKEGELIQQSLSISLDEGFRKYINAFSVLVNNDFSNIPTYIISFRDSIVDFSNMNSQNLSEVQTQIYLILLNYINYSLIFSNSETRLNSEYNRVSTMNKTILLVFMLLIAFLNLGFLILCIWNILIVTQLFLNFITGMIMVMSDKDFKAFYIERIDNLIKVSQLYVENPNLLINQIKKEETKLIRKLQLKSKVAQEKANSGVGEADHLVKKETEIKNYYVDETKVQRVLIPFFFRLGEIFAVYFIVIIVFDIVLFTKFNSLFNINNYIINNYQVETQMYDILVLTQLMTLLNLTQNDFAASLSIENPDSDGVINMKIRETASIIKEIQNEEHNSKSFELISDFFKEQKCETIFQAVNNSLTYSTSSETGINYFTLQGLLCERFGIMSLDSFEFMFNDYTLRIQKLQNLITKYEYAILMRFNQMSEFYDLTTMILLNMQPIRNYIRVVLLDQLMDRTITDFIFIITLYLCCNIVIDLSMHFLIKYSITGQLDVMHRDLLMFNNCFSS